MNETKGGVDFTLEPAELASILIGATLLHNDVGGVIVETEAYDTTDPASHSFNGMTPRNAVMFGPPGHAYVYRSYGIHWCVNVTCGKRAGAVLLRAIEPSAGIEIMRERRGLAPLRLLCAGPGRLCQALAISIAHNGADLEKPPFAINPRETAPDIIVGPRIGITKAVDQPWRFGLKGSRFLSKPFPRA